MNDHSTGMRITDSILNDKERVGTATFSAADTMTKPHMHDKTARRQPCKGKPCKGTTAFWVVEAMAKTIRRQEKTTQDQTTQEKTVRR